MKNCLNCGVELHGLQEMFCSKKCKHSARWGRMTEENKEKQRKKNRDAYLIKKEERLKQKSEYYQQNKDEIKVKNALYKKEHPETDEKYNIGIKGRYRDYKKGAASRNYVFELSLDQFSKYWNNKCYYCNDDINGIGLDRIDNDVGYTIENILPCCGSCNIMRNRLRQQDFINQCHKISLNMKLKELIEQAKNFPNAVIEYSCELPKDLDTKGVKLLFNKDVPKSVGATITYKY